MKRLFFLLFGLTSFGISAYGQVDENKYYLYLFSDSLLYGKEIEYKIPFLGPNYFNIDSRRIELDIVKFYQNETGFYANTKSLSFSGISSFAERLKKGKINLYEKTTKSQAMGHINPSTGMYMGGGGFSKTTYYYNKGFGDLKKANYSNLIIDLSDNAESLLSLNKYKSLRKTEVTFYTIGAALFVGGFISLVNKTKDVDYDTEPHPNLTGNAIIMGTGFACGIVGVTISFGKTKHLKKAIDKYND